MNLKLLRLAFLALLPSLLVSCLLHTRKGQWAVASAPWSKVSGRVTGGIPNAPTARVVLTDGSNAVASSTVGLDGAFEFAEVPTGTYIATLRPTPGSTFAIAAVTVSGAEVTGLELATIPGRIVPVRVTVTDDWPEPRFLLSMSDGASSIPFLLGPVPDQVLRLPLPLGERRLVIDSASLPKGYSLRSFRYGNTDLLTSPLNVSAADTAELHVEFDAAPMDAYKVTGRVAGVDPETFARGTVSVLVLGSALMTGMYMATVDPNDGSFEFPELLPDSYTARVVGPVFPGLMPTPVVVAATDVKNIEIVVSPQKQVNGRIVVEGGEQPPRFTLTLAAPLQPGFSTNSEVAPRPDGTFRVIVPGDERLATITRLPPGYVLESLTYGDKDLLLNPRLRISSADTKELQITLARTTP